MSCVLDLGADEALLAPLLDCPASCADRVARKAVAYEEVEVDLPARAHRRPEFRRLNPFAQVPATASRYAVIEPSKRPGTSIAFLSGSVLIPA